jgi:hypothetical protein
VIYKEYMAKTESLEHTGLDHKMGVITSPTSVRLGGKDFYVFKPQSAEVPAIPTEVPASIDYGGLLLIYRTSLSKGKEAWQSLFPDVTENVAEIRAAIIPELTINKKRASAFAEWDWYDIRPFPASRAEKGNSPLKQAAALHYDLNLAIEAAIHQKLSVSEVGFVLARNKDPFYEKEILLHQDHLKDEDLLQEALYIRDSLRQSVG